MSCVVFICLISRTGEDQKILYHVLISKILELKNVEHLYIKLSILQKDFYKETKCS